jgi:hypothetical protein
MARMKKHGGSLRGPDVIMENKTSSIASIIDMRIVGYLAPSPSASPYVQTVSHLNWLSAPPSYEARAAVEGVK